VAAQRTDLLPLADYPSGSRTFGPRAIADNIVGLVLEFQRCTTVDLTVWPNPLTHLWARMELSLDDGVTWLPAGGMGAFGGILARPGIGGTELADSYLPVDLLPGTGRQLRGTAEVTNGPIRTTVSAVVDTVRGRSIIRPPR
jgi:hypothetical protein